MKREEIKASSYKKWDISEISLIVANLVPLFGALFFGWGVFLVLITYWIESAVIGFYTILKMIISKGIANQNAPVSLVLKQKKIADNLVMNHLMKIFLVPFFMIHYGGFMSVHLIFIFAISSMSNTGFPSLTESLLTISIAAISLFVSHGLSFYYHFIKEKQYEKAVAAAIMMSPYPRIVVMHLTLIFGGFFILAAQIPAALISLFIILKIFVDLTAHRKEHNRFLRTSQGSEIIN
jgi:hypothetical protein